MSFVITVYTHEGVVMAADSRTTLTTQGIGTYEFSNSTRKLFCTARGVGVSTCGNASISGKPVAGFIEDVLRNNAQTPPDQLAQELISFFGRHDPVPSTNFQVCGYDDRGRQRTLSVFVRTKEVLDQNTANTQGVFWDGACDIMIRLLRPMALLNADGSIKEKQPLYSIPFNLFSLQDAIDFAIFATTTTIGAIRFQDRFKTVGGPIDILVVKPDEIVWVQRKMLEIGNGSVTNRPTLTRRPTPPVAIAQPGLLADHPAEALPHIEDTVGGRAAG